MKAVTMTGEHRHCPATAASKDVFCACPFIHLIGKPVMEQRGQFLPVTLDVNTVFDKLQY